MKNKTVQISSLKGGKKSLKIQDVANLARKKEHILYAIFLKQYFFKNFVIRFVNDILRGCDTIKYKHVKI